MMAAASLGFIKALGIAAILVPEEFGQYISWLGIATFAAVFVSFGRIETTIKLYPVVHAAGRGDWIAAHSRELIGWLALTIAAAALLVALAFRLMQAPLALGPLPLTDVVMVALMVWLIGALNVVASIVRAVQRPRLLQGFTLARGGSVLIVALPAAVASGDWRITFIAEALALFIVLCSSLVWLREPLRPTAEGGPLTDIDPRNHRGGGTIYLSSLAGAAIPYGGRGAILALAGPAIAGAFGLLSLIVQIGLMLAGALAQKLGPRMIRAAAQGGLRPSEMVAPVAIMAANAILGTGVLLVTLYIPGFAAAWDRYGIDLPLILLVGVQMFLPVYLFVGFYLMALHREWVMVLASALSVASFYIGLVIVWSLDLGLIGFVVAALVADAVRLVVKSYYAFDFGKKKQI